jgi:Putative phage replication protein RstA
MVLRKNGRKNFSKICNFRGVEMNILVDYLTLSIRQIDLPNLLQILHLENSNLEEGYSRWLGRKLYLGGISIHYGDYIILEMSGHGCRFLESLYENHLNWIDFIEQFLCLEGSHLARLDIACDDRPEVGEKGILSFATIFRHVMQRRYISLSRYIVHTGGSEQSVYFGSPKSDRRLRIYNKAIERGVPDEHWIRAEFQLRNDSALSFYMRALECGSIGTAYQGMLFDFLRFTREVNEDNDHQSRMTVTRWWRTFCGNAKKIKGFYVGGLEYNLESLERYLANQTSSSMKTYLAAHGGDVTELVKMADSATYNKKQEFLVKTQPLINQMHADYDTDYLIEENALNPTEAAALKKAHEEQAKYEERYLHWKPLGCSLDQQAAANSERIMSALAAQDLEF